MCSVISLVNKSDKSITFFEVSIDRFYNYNTFRRINQLNEYQVIKSQISYIKFVIYKAFDMLIKYENKHIYHVITQNNKIKQCFNVE